MSSRQVTSLMREVERLREVRLRTEERSRELERVVTLLARQGLLAETAEARTLLSGVGRALRSDGEETADIVDELEEGSRPSPPVRCAPSSSRCSAWYVTCLASSARRPGSRWWARRCRWTGACWRSSTARWCTCCATRWTTAWSLPETRERSGKHHEGALTLRIEQQGNLLFLESADDGRGIDVKKRAPGGRVPRRGPARTSWRG